MSDEFVAMIQQAAAQPGPSMTAEEFIARLRDIDARSPHPD